MENEGKVGRQGGGGRDGGKDEERENEGGGEKDDWEEEKNEAGKRIYYSHSHHISPVINSAYRLGGKHHLIRDSKLLS